MNYDPKTYFAYHPYVLRFTFTDVFQRRQRSMIPRPKPLEVTPLQGIVHDPYGAGDPYNPGPTERIPHEPEAGVVCSVGAATPAALIPSGEAGRVWVTWRAVRHDSGADSGNEAGLNWGVSHKNWQATASGEVKLLSLLCGSSYHPSLNHANSD